MILLKYKSKHVTQFAQNLVVPSHFTQSKSQSDLTETQKALHHPTPLSLRPHLPQSSPPYSSDTTLDSWGDKDAAHLGTLSMLVFLSEASSQVVPIPFSLYFPL